MKKVLQFTDVGRNKVSWTDRRPLGKALEDADAIAEIAYRQVRLHGQLISNGIDTTYNRAKNEGKILAGFHVVGTFKVIDAPDGEDVAPDVKQAGKAVN